MDEIAARRAAETLLAEHKANQHVQAARLAGRARHDLGRLRYPGADMSRLLRAEHGDAVGYKVGLTSAAMQTFCGIDHPIAGVVLASRVHRSGATRPARGFRAAGPGIRNRRPHQIGRPGHGHAVHRRDDRAAYRRRLRRHRTRRRSQRRLCQPRCAFAGGGQFLERRHRAVGICNDMAGSGERARACNAKTAPRSAKATAATSSAIPSIRSRGLPRSWLRGAKG